MDCFDTVIRAFTYKKKQSDSFYKALLDSSENLSLQRLSENIKKNYKNGRKQKIFWKEVKILKKLHLSRKNSQHQICFNR